MEDLQYYHYINGNPYELPIEVAEQIQFQKQIENND